MNTIETDSQIIHTNGEFEPFHSIHYYSDQRELERLIEEAEEYDDDSRTN